MARISDKDVIKKIKKGEINYYSYIVKKYTTLIYHFIERRLFDKHEVDDLVQNVFILFYKAIEKFDENRPVKPYLFQIVQNELKMYYRSKKEVISLNENIYLSHETNITDDSFLNYLADNQKKIFKLIIDGYSYEEIAELVKKPVNTIKSIVRRGRLKIKSAYADNK